MGLRGPALAALAGCSDVTTLLSPTDASRSIAKPMNAPAVTDIYTCGTLDWGGTWNCIDEGPAIINYYWDDAAQGEQWNYTSPFDCSYQGNNCPSGQSTTTGGNYGLSGEPTSTADADNSSAIPNCSPLPTSPEARSWCLGVAPDGFRLFRIKSALDLMRVINPTCAGLAAIGDTLLMNNRIRLFAKGDVPGLGGSAPQGGATAAYGGATGSYAYLTVSLNWTDIEYNSNHLENSPYHRDLQQLLAHELDHLNGTTPIHADADGYTTPNSQTCGGF